MVNCLGSLGTFLENAKIYCYQLIDHEYQLGQGVCFVSYVTLLLFEKKRLQTSFMEKDYTASSFSVSIPFTNCIRAWTTQLNPKPGKL